MKKIIICCIIIFILSITVLTYAQSSSGDENKTRFQNIEKKLNSIEVNLSDTTNEIKALQQKMDTITGDITNTKVEILAAKKLEEISAKNLAAPTLVLRSIFAILGIMIALGAVIVYIVRKGVLEKIDKKCESLEEIIEQRVGTAVVELNEITKRIEKTEKDHCELLAIGYNSSANNAWQERRYDDAIENGKKAITYWEKFAGSEIENDKMRYFICGLQSNLAYYYVEKNQIEKKAEAINFAELGLEAGIKTGRLNLIDNYLFILMKFGESREHKEKWLDVYKKYKAQIFETGIRVNDEIKEFETYSQKIKKNKKGR